jgi:hypothetical protein
VAGNELEIKVTADTAQAQKGIDGLEKSLQGLEKAGEGANNAAKGMDNLATSAGKVEKSLPKPGAATGLSAVGTAAEKTAVQAAAAATSIKSLGDAGAVAGAKLKSGLSGALGNAVSGLSGVSQAEGAIIGTSLTEGILAGLGGLALGLTAALGAALAGAAYLARLGGQEFADEYKKAIDSGLTVQQFQGFEALGQVLGLQGKEIDKFAAKMGDLQEAFRKGKVPDNVEEGLKKLGISLKDLASTDAAKASAELFKLGQALRQMPQDVRSDFLKDLFKLDPAGLAAMNKTMMDTSLTATDVANKLAELTAKQQVASEQNERMGKSWDTAVAGMKEAADQFAVLIGFPSLWEAGVSVVVALTNELAQAFRDLSAGITTIVNVKNAITQLFEGLAGGGVEKFVESFKSLDKAFDGTPTKIIAWVQNVSTVINDGVNKWGNIIKGWGAVAASAIADGASAAVAAAQGVVDAIVGVFTGLVDRIKGIFDSVMGAITSGLNSLKSAIGGMGALGGAGPVTGGGFMAPVQSPQQLEQFRSLLRGAGVVTPQAMGLIGTSRSAPTLLAAPTATGSSGGTLSPGQIKSFTDAYYQNTTAIKANTAAKTENKVATDAANASGALSAQQLAAYAKSLLDTLDPMRVYNEEMAKYDQALKAGLISSDAFALAQQRAQKAMEGVATTAGAANQGPMKDFQEGLKSWGDSVASSLADAIVEGKDLGEVFMNLVKQLAKMAIEALVLKPLMSAITGGLGGIFGGGASALAAPSSIGASTLANTSNAIPMGIVRAGTTGSSSPNSGVGGRSGGKVNNSINNTLGDMTINMGNTAPQVSADGEQAEKFGLRVRSLIQQELVNQSRPGGLLRGS